MYVLGVRVDDKTLIIDNLSAHHAKILISFLEKCDVRFILCRLICWN